AARSYMKKLIPVQFRLSYFRAALAVVGCGAGVDDLLQEAVWERDEGGDHIGVNFWCSGILFHALVRRGELQKLIEIDYEAAPPFWTNHLGGCQAVFLALMAAG